MYIHTVLTADLHCNKKLILACCAIGRHEKQQLMIILLGHETHLFRFFLEL